MMGQRKKTTYEFGQANGDRLIIDTVELDCIVFYHPDANKHDTVFIYNEHLEEITEILKKEVKRRKIAGR